MITWKKLADASAARDISAGPPSLLVQRREVRHEHASASVAATSVAAGAPQYSALRNTKMSPGVIEVLVPGIVIGLKPARKTTSIRAATPSLPCASRPSEANAAYASASAPAT